MEAIRIKNLRLLEDTGFIELTPITVLLGANSSGKSSFLRSFLLIRQSLEKRVSAPILWYGGDGGFVDFGSFNEAVYNFDNQKEISFIYKLPIDVIRRRWRLNMSLKEKTSITFEVKISNNQNNVVINSCLLNFFDHQIKITLNQEGMVENFIVNNNNFSEEASNLKNSQSRGGIVPHFTEIRKDEDESPRILRPNNSSSVLFSNLKDEVKKLLRANTKDETIINIIHQFPLGNSEDILDVFKKIKFDSWKKKTSSWTIDNSDYQLLRDIFIANICLNILSILEDYFTGFFQNISYIKPLRATASRYYRYQDLAVGEVDPNGENLPMFLKSLKVDQEDSFLQFKRWTEKYFKFSVDIHQSEGHVSLKIKELDSKQETNLADTGFGFSQILPIVTQLWCLTRKDKRSNINYPVTFAIEQPELHLHPKLQALLADAFIAAIQEAKEQGIDLRVVIETHSKTMVNRFGRRIESQDLKPDDINVVIFDREESHKSSTVTTVNYDKEGFLENWPIGFFEPDIIKEKLS
jgi:predicted ATPase